MLQHDSAPVFDAGATVTAVAVVGGSRTATAYLGGTLESDVVPSSGLAELLSSPEGRYLAGPVSVSFIADASLVGVAVWGRPSVDELLQLLRMHERMRPVLARRTTALVDVRHLEWPDPSAFAALIGYLNKRRDWLAEYIERLALVRPRLGPVSAASAGFFDVSPKPFAVRTFTDLRGALDWAGRADAEALETELESLIAEATGTPPLLRALRAVLEAQPGRLSLESAAHLLGVTERTLQRRLKSWSTTFQNEQNHAQVRVAQRLLAETDSPVTQIAVEVGCASLSQFSALFRRVTGEAPTDWRKQQRRGVQG